MNKKITATHLSIALIAGSIWGFTEVALGAGLRSCAHLVSGSLMTGVALFFIAGTWSATRNILVPLLTVLIASIFKLFDAALLSLPVMSGAIGNPVFAFILEGLAFVALIMLFRNIKWKRSSAVLLGAGTAMIAVGLFPLVKFATGVPACIYPNTSIPLSIYFSPIAIAFSALTVPLGLFAGARFSGRYEDFMTNVQNRLTKHILPPATAGIFLVMLLAFRTLVS
ncbi:MAG: hypothetical protein K9J30_11845 [Bacteroidales bacterium]|nr:hypothetical protein [Bacteroidales bacterium]